jgi:hypothetical protein
MAPAITELWPTALPGGVHTFSPKAASTGKGFFVPASARSHRALMPSARNHRDVPASARDHRKLTTGAR